MALPNFICIGAQKAGTTPLFHLLKQHPDIFLYPQKETHFFYTFRHDPPAHLYEWAFFAGYAGQRAIGEISPEYIRTPGGARAVRQRLGAIKIIICLREPVARAFSHYLHCLRAAEDNRSFFEACRSDAELPLWSDRHEDICRAYVRGSWYAYQIEEWRREFGSDNLFFCILERDLANDRGKLELLQRLMGFLDLATTGVEFKLDVPNVSAPCPKVYFPTTHETVWSRGTGNVVIEPPDILIEYGKARRIVRRPSAELRSFFETMAHEMTPGLSAEARQFLRQKYFAQVGDQISDLVADDVNALWYK